MIEFLLNKLFHSRLLDAKKNAALSSIQQSNSHADFQLGIFKFCNEVVMSAVKKDGMALRLVSHRLRKNADIVSAAVSSKCFAIQFAHSSLRDNKEIMAIAVAKNGLTLKHASARLRNDPDIVKAAIPANLVMFSPLAFASPKLQDDFDIVKLAVSENGMAYKYASEHLKNNKEIMLSAIKQHPHAAFHFPKKYFGKERTLLPNTEQIISQLVDELHQDRSTEVKDSLHLVLNPPRHACRSPKVVKV